MGTCLSRATGAARLIEVADGDEDAFHKRYIEDRVLGEGEFGIVKLVHDMTEAPPDPGGTANSSLACKTLRKGVVFKDNTLYSPIKPECLQAEVNILRTLNGQHFCLGLKGVYETSRVILMITEYCAGGEMMEYVSKQEADLRTEDVSRISFQLIDALTHCATHNIIHRDIKPENLMFLDANPGSALRVIDFGSGTNRVIEEGNHTTFAGSAFYISPEMFQRTYTQKTDIWSAGVTLYVLVAGYPADVLQKAFNMLQNDGNRNLRELPNLPHNLPDAFYEMLEGMLVYRHKKRKSASDLLSQNFVQFHKTSFKDEADELTALVEVATNAIDVPGTPVPKRHRRTRSVTLKGSVGRHSMFLDYQKFERSLTTLLATMLDKSELSELLKTMDESRKPENTGADDDEKADEAALNTHPTRLDVIELTELKAMLAEQKQSQVLSMLAKLPDSESYDSFAYHVNLLKEFGGDDVKKGGSSFRRRARSNSMRAGGRHVRDSSIRSAGSMRGFRPSLGGSNRGAVNTSVHGSGGGVYQEWKKKGLNNPRKNKERSNSMSR